MQVKTPMGFKRYDPVTLKPLPFGDSEAVLQSGSLRLRGRGITADAAGNIYLLVGLRPGKDQLPPGLKRDDSRLEDFLALLPQQTHHAIEFRHKSWLDDAVYRILRCHNVAFCIFDLPGFRAPPVATADFAYVRFHGNQRLYGGSYTDEELANWARVIKALDAGKVYAYFNNDADGFAVDNALTLKRLLESYNPAISRPA